MEIVEELKKPFTREEFFGTVLPIGGGLVTVHYLGARAKNLVARLGVPAGWVKPAADVALGIGVLAANATIVPEEYKEQVRLVGITCFGLAVLNGLKAAGIISSPRSKPAGATREKQQPKQQPGYVGPTAAAVMSW